jgi:hypothetical protein
MPMAGPDIRAVVYREGEWWIVQLLEYDLATQVRRLEDVPSEVRRLILAQTLVNAESGVEPFHGFSKAPRRFWTLYEQARALAMPARLADPGPGLESPRIETRLAA